MISVIADPQIQYPDANDCFSPDERYPEYRHAHVSGRKNTVYKAVRDCFLQAGLDGEHQGTPEWNPLAQYIRPGSRVFLLCNFASQRRPDERLQDYRSRCTHGSVIRALVDYILIATGEKGSVKVGNAPVQFTHWDAVLKDTEAQVVLDFYRSVGAPVEASDLRLYVTDATQMGAVKGVERRTEADGVHVCLDSESLFAELDRQQSNRYRVMNYDPRRTDSFHSRGHHEYVINHHILESDVVFSCPKLKTHEKVGISCALKGMVGTVGHKDSLPHHRYGSPDMGGDEYPPNGIGLMRFASAFHELAQKTRPDSGFGSLLRVSYKVYRRIIRRWTPVVDGAWWGNDTAWRMVLDLARIATYADAAGQLQESPCRTHLALTDGIIGGEGEGPAYSTAVRAGALVFGDDLVAEDHVNARLMGFDPEKMPLLSEAERLQKYPLLRNPLSRVRVKINGEDHGIPGLKSLLPAPFEAQSGWKDVLE